MSQLLLFLFSNCVVQVLSDKFNVTLCPGNNILNLTCGTNQTSNILRWNISAPAINISEQSRPLFSGLFPIHGIKIGSVTFNFSLLSGTMNFPLRSDVIAENLTADLNGTTITCSEQNSNGVKIISTTRIHIIGNEILHTLQSIPAKANISEDFGINYVTVTVLIDENNFPLSYNVSTTSTLDMIVTGSTNVQIMVPYNELHNLSIVASLCGIKDTSIHRLFYATCDYPLPQRIDGDTEVQVSDYGDLAIVGTNVTLSCPSGLIGPNTSTCTGNRKWEPDPTDAICKANCSIPIVNGSINFSYNSTLEGSLLQFSCNDSLRILVAECHSDGNWNPDPYSTCFVISPFQPDNPAGSTMVLITSLSSLCCFIILTSAIIAAISIIIKRLKGSPREKRSLDIDNELTTHRPYLGEYSLVQYSAEGTLMDDNNTKGAAAKKQTLVYADIGPMSLKQRVHVPDLQLDDSRVEYAQLTVHADKDIKLQNTQLEVYFTESAADNSLNLDSLLIQLKPTVTDQWYQFGEAIGVNKQLLDKCTQYSAEESMVEILDNWLRNHEDRPTWTEVADALDKIGLQHLGTDIRNVYKTGKLPIEVDMNAEIPMTESPPPIPPRMHAE